MTPGTILDYVTNKFNADIGLRVMGIIKLVISSREQDQDDVYQLEQLQGTIDRTKW